MSNRKLFNRLVKDPATFEIKGKDFFSRNEATNARLLSQLDNFNDRIENFIGDYAHHAQFDIDLKDEPNKNDVIQQIDLEQYDRELVTFRMEFIDFVHEGAMLLNCDTRDIYDAFEIDETEVNKSFGRMRDNADNINDQDALRILSGLHNETSAYSCELSVGQRYMETTLSNYLTTKDMAGIMYIEPEIS